jgi:hypothetical protein
MTRNSSKPVLAGFLLLTVGLLAGCGEGSYDNSGLALYPVKGSVSLASGKPLTGGKVIFMPKKLGGVTSIGKIGADGTYTLSTSDGREGAAEGEYRVRVEPDEAIFSKRTKTGSLKNLPFPASYMDEDGDTGLTASVKPSENQLEPLKLVPPRKEVDDHRRD